MPTKKPAVLSSLGGELIFSRAPEEAQLTFGYHPGVTDLRDLLEAASFSRLLVVGGAVRDVVDLVAATRTIAPDVELPRGLYWFSGIDQALAMLVNTGSGALDGTATPLEHIADGEPIAAARRRLPMVLGGLDALELAHWVGRDGLVQHGLLQDAGDDRADGSPGVRRVPNLLRGGGVLVLDRAPGLLQPAEEGIDVGDIALAQLQRAELGEHQLVEPVAVGVGRGVFTTLLDLRHPHGRGVSEPGEGPEQLVALASAFAQLGL